MKVIRGIEKFIHALSLIDGFIIIGLMLLIATDIIMRLFNHGINGSTEIVVSVMVVIVYLGVGYCSSQEMHIRVDVIKAWPWLDRITNLICIAAIAIIAYQCYGEAMNVKALATSSNVINIPRWPFVLTTAFGTAMVVVAMVLNEIKAYAQIFAYRKSKRKEIEA